MSGQNYVVFRIYELKSIANCTAKLLSPYEIRLGIFGDLDPVELNIHVQFIWN